MKVFVTGVGGQLGHDVMNELLQSVAMRALALIFQEVYSGVADGTAVTTSALCCAGYHR